MKRCQCFYFLFSLPSSTKQTQITNKYQTHTTMKTSSPAITIVLLLLSIVMLCSSSSSSTISAQTTTAPNTTTANGTTTAAPSGGGTTGGIATTVGEASVVDLIFSFFSEDSDSINSYAVTIAQHLSVPTRRVDFYNVQPGDTTSALDRTPSNTPFGPNTMARVTIQPAFSTPGSTTDPETSVSVRDRLVEAVQAGDTALTGIFIIDAYPIDSKEIFSYAVRTVFDLMYTFIIATMGVSYLGFIGFVIYKLIDSHQHAKMDRLNRQKEKEEKKLRREAMRRAGKMDADMDDDDDENEQIDATRFDEFGGDGDDDDGGQGDIIRDEDGLAIRSLAQNVASMIDDEGHVISGLKFSEGSRRPGGGIDNSKRLRELQNLALPTKGGMYRDRDAGTAAASSSSGSSEEKKSNPADDDNL